MAFRQRPLLSISVALSLEARVTKRPNRTVSKRSG